jgi:thymidylate synthase (FAD)
LKLISPSYEFITPLNEEGAKTIMKRIELAARTCYKSDDNFDPDNIESANRLVGNLIKRGHEAMLEHASLTFKWICDRGVTHELVRHRLASFAQESSRYCSYDKDKFGNECTFIIPSFYLSKDPDREQEWKTWKFQMESAEKAYMRLIELGSTAQEARSVLPNSTKTEIVVTMNMRELRHFLGLRAEVYAHPQMSEIARPMLEELYKYLPVLFGDVVERVNKSYEK